MEAVEALFPECPPFADTVEPAGGTATVPSEFTGVYPLFINTCSAMDYGERVLVTDDIYMYIISEDQLNFIDKSERFNLELRFDSRGGQELMDAILDLSGSILLKTR